MRTGPTGFHRIYGIGRAGVRELLAEKAKEALIYSALPAAQGRAAIFGACNALKMKESGNHSFRFPC
jgi:hypothetical protein